jgi:hypothetical protein
LDLIGNVIDIETGQWIHTASSVGAGIDSFFEYLAKAYVLFGDDEYLNVFNEAYVALLRYIRDESGYFYRNVNMFDGGLMAYWVDSLSAFLPGLQVKPKKKMTEHFYGRSWCCWRRVFPMLTLTTSFFRFWSVTWITR